MPAWMAAWLARSRACDGTAAVSDVRPPDGMAGAAGAFVGFEGGRAAGAPARGRGAAAAEPETKTGLGRPGGTRRPDPAAPQALAGGPAGDAGHAAALAPSAGPLALDLPSAGRMPHPSMPSSRR